MEILEEKKNKNRKYKPILDRIPDWPVYQLSKNRKEFIAEVTQKSTERIKELRPSADGSGVEIETYMSASSYDPNPEKKRTATRRVSRFESTPQGWRVAEQSAWTSVGDVVMAGNKVRVEEDANTPPRLVMEREGRKPVVLHDFNPWLSEVHLQPIRPVTWRDKENHPWSGGIALPPSSGKNGKPPLILALKFHEPRRFSPDGPYTTAFATQALAAKGFAVIELDAVDPPSYETEREGPTEMRGIESAIDFAATAYGVDADRVGLIGFSRTSYYVVHTLVNSQKRFVAATLSDGVDGGYVQYQAYTLNHFGGYLGRAFAQMQGGHPFGKGLDAWRKNAAMFNLDRVKTPLRVGPLAARSFHRDRRVLHQKKWRWSKRDQLRCRNRRAPPNRSSPAPNPFPR